ncbi:YbaN family protein [Pseudoalteromonas spongiae]|uniref:YbaN family protein n=1 Tax=Pseudoalteromonas spongiae TaxID=298657 RepID=UPI000C2D38CD|nr:YbaN family protein [Pseudoalteromonas spongiae]
MLKKTVIRSVWLLIGLVSLLLGILGVFLPLLPTTPFVLLSAFCFSKSSTRMHSWLLNHRIFGQLITDWEMHGVIRAKVKVIATCSMLLLVSYPLLFIVFPIWLKAIVVISIVSVLLFIWSRPSKPSDNQVKDPLKL